MRTISTAPARGAASYTLHFAPDELAAVRRCAAASGLTMREWLTRTVRAALTPAVVAERALTRTLSAKAVVS